MNTIDIKPRISPEYFRAVVAYGKAQGWIHDAKPETKASGHVPTKFREGYEGHRKAAPKANSNMSEKNWTWLKDTAPEQARAVEVPRDPDKSDEGED